MAFAEEVMTLLQTNAVITALGTDGFISEFAQIPVGDGPYVSLVETTSLPPERTQNSAPVRGGAGIAYQRPIGQLVVRAKLPQVARAKAKQAYDVIARVRNVEIAGTWYREMSPIQEVRGMGLDSASRARYGFNFFAYKRPS